MRQVFVFGSNLAGIHGAGSARAALEEHGAVYGQGVGMAGNSYAIPTKDENIRTMRLEQIEPYVSDFVKFAKANPDMQFNIVAIGCGLAGFTPKQIAPMFEGAPDNCMFIGAWRKRRATAPKNARQTACAWRQGAPIRNTARR